MATTIEQVVDNVSFGPSKQIYNYLPLGILAVEAFCAVLCNGAVLLLFCTKRSLLRTASDLFTINLSLVDLIFSGIVLPLVILAALTPKKKCEEERTIEIIRNCAVIFATVATALATLLVSLDRGDVSLKPSKRFFTQSKAILGIGATWFTAAIGLGVTIFPRLLSPNEANQNLTQDERKSTYISSILKNSTTIKYLNPVFSNTEECCRASMCSLSTLKECTYQLSIEIPTFVLAIVTIVIIYGKILRSVQQRSKKYMHGASKHTIPSNNYYPNRAHQSNFCGFTACCSAKERCPETPEKTVNEKSSGVAENGHTMSPQPQQLVKKDSFRRRSLTVIKNFTSTGHKGAKKQDSLEDKLFVNGKTDEHQDSSNVDGAKSSQKKKKTDFASVAMSVTVFLALRRMAARKIKERKKKIRHLRKMTFFIIFTFLFCWMPYYVTKVSIVISLHLQQNSATISPTNATDINVKDTLVTRCPPGWLFTWTLAVAALSCNVNPILYMFSREKIRLEFVKMFFPACASASRNGQHRSCSCSASCFVCWETEENFKDKLSVNAQGSVINAMQKNRGNTTSAKSKMELKKIPSQGSCSREEGTEPSSTSPEIPKTRVQLSAPLLRWNAVNCDEPAGAKSPIESEQRNITSQNNHLLLPSTQHNRPRSLSAQSVDILSCSTTIASLAAEI